MWLASLCIQLQLCESCALEIVLELEPLHVRVGETFYLVTAGFSYACCFISCGVMVCNQIFSPRLYAFGYGDVHHSWQLTAVVTVGYNKNNNKNYSYKKKRQQQQRLRLLRLLILLLLLRLLLLLLQLPILTTCVVRFACQKWEQQFVTQQL